MKKRFFLILLAFSFISAKAQIITQSDWQQHISYQIEVSLDDVNHTLKGKLNLVYTNNSPDTLASFYMHLWPNAYSSDKTALAKQLLGNGKTDMYYADDDERGGISGVNFFVNGDAVTWNYYQKQLDIAELKLNEPLLPGESLTLSTDFMVDIPLVFSRLGHDDQDYYITQWYPKPAVYDVNGWNPMPYLDQGEFYSEFGEFEVSVTLPENYVIAATGELQTESEKEFRQERIDNRFEEDTVPPSSSTMKTVVFTAENVHDFAWFASKSFNIAKSEVEFGGKTIETYVYAYEYSPRLLDPIATAIKHYSSHVGPYPYPHASVVVGELEAGGGMEYPMITLCDMTLDEVIIHEVGHNWFYGVLGSNERVYPWMDESINSFYDGTAEERNKFSDGQDLAFSVFYKDAVLANESQPIGGHSADFTWNNYGIVVYGIGSGTFHHLREYLGQAVYDSAMHHYYEKWMFKHPLPGDMKQAFEESTGEDLSWFFNDIIAEGKKMDYGLKVKNGKAVLYNKGETAAPVPVTYPLFGKAKTEWYSVAPGEELILELGDKASTARVDPEGLTTDIFSNNDAPGARIVAKPFIGKDLKGVRELYLAPAMGWNQYNGFMLGLLMHNYSLSNKRFQYHLAPMYSFTQSTLAGVAQLSYHGDMKGPGAGIDYKLDVRRFTWTQNNFTEFHYNKVSPSIEFLLPRKSYRSKKEKKIVVGVDHIFFNPAYDVEEARKESFNPNYTYLNQWSFITMEYQFKNDQEINPLSFSLELEQGFTSNNILFGMRDTSFAGGDTLVSFPRTGDSLSKSNHTKISATFNYKLDIGIKNKPLEIRVFASYFIEPAENGYFDHLVSNAGLTRDYRFREYALHRNADYGMFRNQISTFKEQSKFVGILGQSDRMIANINIFVPIPGKIPVRPYLELLTYTDIDKSSFNKSEASLIYNLGIELRVIPDVFNVYFNLAQSNDVTTAQESFQGIDKFHERITFTLKLNGLTPANVKKSISLF
ncbi:M1 family metallopeptidase [bacterium]|nr:M1 family metallopeptidase [bacterium]